MNINCDTQHAALLGQFDWTELISPIVDAAGKVGSTAITAQSELDKYKAYLTAEKDKALNVVDSNYLTIAIIGIPAAALLLFLLFRKDKK